MPDYNALERRLEILIKTGFTALESKIGDLDVGFKHFAEAVKQDFDYMRDVGERTERRLVALETRPPIGITPPPHHYSATVIHSVSAPKRRRRGYYGS
jgi:hypothetical protein